MLPARPLTLTLSNHSAGRPSPIPVSQVPQTPSSVEFARTRSSRSPTAAKSRCLVACLRRTRTKERSCSKRGSVLKDAAWGVRTCGHPGRPLRLRPLGGSTILRVRRSPTGGRRPGRTTEAAYGCGPWHGTRQSLPGDLAFRRPDSRAGSITRLGPKPHSREFLRHGLACVQSRTRFIRGAKNVPSLRVLTALTIHQRIWLC
jgi:hypothetical protein